MDTTQPIPQPWSRKVVNCETLAWSLAPLFIYRSNLDLMQQLCEQMGLVEAPWLHAVAESYQEWPEALSLHFLQFLWCSSRYALKKEPNDYSWCLLSQMEDILSQDSEKSQAFPPARQLKRKTVFSTLNFDVLLHWSYSSGMYTNELYLVIVFYHAPWTSLIVLYVYLKYTNHLVFFANTRWVQTYRSILLVARQLTSAC